MSILTFKVQHTYDFSQYLKKAKQVAVYTVNHKKEKVSTKDVKHFGLTASISNQIICKYGSIKTIKEVKNIKLVIANYFLKHDEKNKEVYIPSLKTKFHYQTHLKFSKINCIEIDNKNFYVSVTVDDLQPIDPTGSMGIDRNTTKHCVVCACDKTKKVMMLGKKAQHIHTKYSKMRKYFQRLNKLKKLKAIKRRESNITKDLNHKMSRKVVNYAKDNNVEIKLENLSQEKIDLLEQLPNWEWEINRDESWKETYDNIKSFYDKNSKYPSQHSKNLEEKKWGSWINTQRQENWNY